MAFDDPLIQRKLGDYTIVSLLGRGGMSRVYRGFDENLQRYAAVKVISGDFATTTEEEYTRRFTSEARAIAHLRHPNIVGVYQFGRTEGIYYMAQVFLEGQDLRTLLKSYADNNERIPTEQMLRIVRDVASALDYAHQQGVIHRDIKPSNIMLEKNTGRAILMDFGLAMSVHEGTMGDTFGSAHYIAPEQAISSAKSVPQSDQYSLGIVIYEMLAGKVPFDDPSVMSVALKHLNEVPPPPTMYNPDLPPVAEAVILKALHKDPARRHPSVTALADALQAAFAGAEQAHGTVDYSAGLVADAPVLPDSRPTPPGKRPISDSAFPPMEVDSPPGGVMGRFARRRLQREQEAAQNRPLNEAEVPLDDHSIDSLLQSMDQPFEQTSTQDRLQADEPLSSLLRREVPAPITAKPAGKPRRLRNGLLVVLLLVAFGAAAWFGLGLGDSEDEEPGSALIADATGTAGTRAAILQPSLTPDNASGSLSGSPESMTSVTLGATERPTATVAPSSTPTAPSTETATVPATEAATATAVATSESEKTPTERPTHTATATVAPTSTLEATETTATSAALVGATPGPAGMETPPDIRVTYSRDEFLLINVSGKRLDVSSLVFEQARPDGSTLSFRATQWDRPDISIKPNRMAASGCYQLITTTATQVVPDTTVCPFFLGFLRSNVARSYFWIADDAEAAFTVRLEGAQVPLATCPIAAGECAFVFDDTSVGIPDDGTPAVGQIDEPTIRIIYDDRSFILINISPSTQDISQLHFVLEEPDGTVRSFLSAEWDDAGIVGRTSSLRSGGCLELITSEADVVTPDTVVCPSFLGWFRSNLSERYFWLSSVSGQAFEVRIANEGTLLATCEIAAGECEFSIPGQP